MSWFWPMRIRQRVPFWRDTFNFHVMNRVPENPEIFRINAQSKSGGFAHTRFAKAAENTSPMEVKRHQYSPSYAAKRSRRGLGGGPAVVAELGSQAHRTIHRRWH